jgi:hypothetical protein
MNEHDEAEKTATELPPVKPFGELIDGMYELRNEREKLTSAAKKIGEKLVTLEAEIIARLDSDAMTMGRGREASATLTEVEVPKVDSWDDFYAYIGENEAYHLLQRRPSSAACRETIESGEEIAGVGIFTKRSISLRKIT